VRRWLVRSDSKSITPPSYINRLERSDSSTEKRSDNMNNIPYRLSSRDSFSSSLRSSHIPPSYVTKILPLVASLLRFWWGDAWNLTAIGHGVVSWVLMHWIKGSANFYDQNELNSLTWFEQLSASPTYPNSYYSSRFLVSVPTILTYIACHMSDYDIRTVSLNMVILFILVLSKQDFMHGVRVLGINRTVGIDDGSKAFSRNHSEMSLNKKGQ